MLYRKPNSITGNTFTTLLKIQHYRNHHNITGSKQNTAGNTKLQATQQHYRKHNVITENRTMLMNTQQNGRNPGMTAKSLLATQH